METERIEKQENSHPLVRRWRWIFALSMLGAATALAYTAWIPAKYRVRTQVLLLPTADSASLGPSLLSGNTATPLTILQGIFDSDAMAGALAQQFKMDESAVRSIWFVRSDPLANQLEVLADSTSPDMARKMVEFSVRKAREFELGTNESAASKRQAQLKVALDQQFERNLSVESELAEALRNATSLPDEASISDDASSTLAAACAERTALRSKLDQSLSDAELPKDGKLDALRVKLRGLQNELTSLSSKYGPAAPEIQKTEDQIQVTQNQYRRELTRVREAVRSGVLSQISDLDSKISGLEVAAGASQDQAVQGPKDRATLASRTRHLAQAYETTTELRMQYEQARVDAEVERVNWAVVTPAFREERSINKRWARNPAAGAVLGMLLAAFLAYSVPNRPAAKRTKNMEEEEPTWPTAA